MGLFCDSGICSDLGSRVCRRMNPIFWGDLQIKEQLNADVVVVKDAYGDGRHVRFAS